MPADVRNAFNKACGEEFFEGFGLAGTSPVATFNQLGLPRKVGSIGLPVFGVEVRIVDDQGNDVPVNEPGEIVIRGHNVMKGYYNKPEANTELSATAGSTLATWRDATKKATFLSWIASRI